MCKRCGWKSLRPQPLPQRGGGRMMILSSFVNDFNELNNKLFWEGDETKESRFPVVIHLLVGREAIKHSTRGSELYMMP